MLRPKGSLWRSVVSTILGCESLVVGLLIGAVVLHLSSCADGTGSSASAKTGSVSEADRARLVSQFEHSDWLVREMSAEALGEFDDPRVIDALIQALDDEHSRPRQAAARSLGELKATKAVPKLIKRLEMASEKEDVQPIIIALGEIGDPRAVEPIAGAIKRHGQTQDLYSICRSIIGFEDPRIADALLQIMRFENGRLNYNVVYQLARLKEKRLFGPLVDVLQQEDRKSWRAAEVLGRLGDPRAVEPLMDALQSGSTSIREHAAEALGLLGDEGAVPALIGILTRTDEEEEVQEAACRALGRLGDLHAVTVIERFNTHPEDRLRVAAGEAIADIELGAFRAWHREGSEKATEIAADALQEGPLSQRRAAIRVLSEIGTDEAQEAIIVALKDSDVMVRLRAIYSLSSTDDPRAVAALESALADPVDENRWIAVQALAEEGNRNALPTLIEFTRSSDEHRRRYATRLLRHYHNPEAIAASCALLNDPEEDVREEAAQALGAVADTSALEPLLRVFEGGSSGGTRASAARALGRIYDPRSIAALEKALSEDDHLVTLLAARSLARLGWEPPNETLWIRYMIASGRADEADASLPEAKQVDEGFRLEGPFALDMPILTPLTIGTKEYPKVVMLHRIEFSLVDHELHGKLFVNHITWPDSAWLITVDLLNESGERVASANYKYRIHGFIAGVAAITDVKPVVFSFGEARIPDIKRFAIMVEETVPGHESYIWFRNPSNGHSYCLTDLMPWKAARADAVRLGGDLVTINNREENEWLQNTFNDCGTLFIGLNDLEQEGAWKWVNGEESGYRNWNDDEPNDAHGNEDIAEIYSNGKWNDISAAAEGRGIVEAERPPEGSGRE